MDTTASVTDTQGNYAFPDVGDAAQLEADRNRLNGRLRQRIDECVTYVLTLLGIKRELHAQLRPHIDFEQLQRRFWKQPISTAKEFYMALGGEVSSVLLPVVEMLSDKFHQPFKPTSLEQGARLKRRQKISRWLQTAISNGEKDPELKPLFYAMFYGGLGCEYDGAESVRKMLGLNTVEMAKAIKHYEVSVVKFLNLCRKEL